MKTFKEEYQHWLDSPALSEAEWQELKAIENDDKEIEARFFAPLEFGTAGLRGEMAVGLHRMNVHHPPRHPGFRERHQGRGAGGLRKGRGHCLRLQGEQ